MFTVILPSRIGSWLLIASKLYPYPFFPLWWYNMTVSQSVSQSVSQDISWIFITCHELFQRGSAGCTVGVVGEAKLYFFVAQINHIYAVLDPTWVPVTGGPPIEWLVWLLIGSDNEKHQCVALLTLQKKNIYIRRMAAYYFKFIGRPPVTGTPVGFRTVMIL